MSFIPQWFQMNCSVTAADRTVKVKMLTFVSKHEIAGKDYIFPARAFLLMYNSAHALVTGTGLSSVSSN